MSGWKGHKSAPMPFALPFGAMKVRGGVYRVMVPDVPRAWMLIAVMFNRGKFYPAQPDLVRRRRTSAPGHDDGD